MREDIGDHQSGEDVENYSLGRLAPSAAAVVEQHLSTCRPCRADLAAVEPYNFVHYTGDGPFHSRITKLRSGGFVGRHWGRSLEGGKEFHTRRGAKAYLERTFARIFPEHACTARCGAGDRG
jgi:hypothetical protein